MIYNVDIETEYRPTKFKTTKYTINAESELQAALQAMVEAGHASDKQAALWEIINYQGAPAEHQECYLVRTGTARRLTVYTGDQWIPPMYRKH